MTPGARRCFARPVFVLALGLIASLGALAQGTPAERGLAWLQSRVQADGAIQGEA